MLKKFLSYYKPHRTLFVRDMVCAVLIGLINLIYPIITREYISNYVPNNALNLIIASASVLLVAFVIKYFLNHYVQYWGHVMGIRIQCDIREKAFNHLQKMPFSYFDKTKSGDIMSRIITDTENIAEFAHHGPEDMVVSILTLLGAFIVLLFINPILTLIIFATIPIFLLVSLKSRNRLSEITMVTRKDIGQVNATLENSIAGIRVSKAYGAYEVEMGKFKTSNRKFELSAQKRYKYMADFYSGSFLMLDILVVITLLLAGIFAYAGYITIADFAAYLLYINLFSEPLRSLVVFFEMFQTGMVGFRRINELLELPTEENSLKAKKLEKIKGDIVFDNVKFRYQKEKENVFDNLNLRINAGQTFALVGPSGGGKSTICHLIPRFYELDAGSISLDGTNIEEYSRLSLRQHIGIVQQDTFLFTGTIKENIAYGNFSASDEEIVIASKAANIHDFIIRLPDGYNTFVGERGVMLSGGQKQRVSIARIFLKNPRILILDEATSALDNTTELAIQESLNELSKNRTTIVVAHRLSTIKNADVIGYIGDNKLLELGSHNELLNKNGYYTELWNSQLRGDEV